MLAVATPVLDGRTREHPLRPCGRAPAYFWGVTQTLLSAGCSPIVVSTRVGLDPRCVWRDPGQADGRPAPGEGEGGGMQEVPLPHVTSG